MTLLCTISQQEPSGEAYSKIKKHFYRSNSLHHCRTEENGQRLELILCKGCHKRYLNQNWNDINMHVNVLGYYICIHVVALSYTCGDYIFFHKKGRRPHECPNIDGGRLLPFDGKKDD